MRADKIPNLLPEKKEIGYIRRDGDDIAELTNNQLRIIGHNSCRDTIAPKELVLDEETLAHHIGNWLMINTDLNVDKIIETQTKLAKVLSQVEGNIKVKE